MHPSAGRGAFEKVAIFFVGVGIVVGLLIVVLGRLF